MQLGLGVVADRLVRVEEAGLAEHPRRPAVGGVARDGDRALGERLGLVVELGQVDVGRGAHALAARAHAAGDAEASALGLAGAALDLDRPAARHRGDVERVRLGPPMCGRPTRLKTTRSIALASVTVPTVERTLAPIRSWSRMIAVVRPFERVDVGPGQRRHEALHEGAVGLVDQPLRLRGDRAEDERALARARHAGEHGQPALRDVEADVAEVVLAGAADLDRAPVAGQVSARRLSSRARRSASRPGGQLGHARTRPATSRRRRSARPAGSRTSSSAP